MNNLARLKHKKQIIYDFDGTIAKLKINWAGWHDGIEKIFLKYEPSFDRAGTVHQYTNFMIKKYGRSIRDEISNFNKDYENTFCESMLINNDLIKYIKTNPLQKHHILTSQNHLLLDRLLDEINIRDLFEKIITRDDVLLVKPDTEGMLKIIDNQKVEDFIYLGDADSDKKTAEAVGMDFEWIKIE